MASAGIFRAVAEMALGAKARRDQENEKFLSFYRELVETLPTDVTELFGHMGKVAVTLKNGETPSWGIELTATDYIWWCNEIRENGVRFTQGPRAVEQAMIARLAKQAESQRLTPEERKKLISLLDDFKAAPVQ